MSIEMCLLSSVVPHGSGEAHNIFQCGHGLPSISWVSKIARTYVKYCSISWHIMCLNKLYDTTFINALLKTATSDRINRLTSESCLRTILNFPYHFPMDQCHVDVKTSLPLVKSKSPSLSYASVGDDGFDGIEYQESTDCSIWKNKVHISPVL